MNNSEPGNGSNEDFDDARPFSLSILAADDDKQVLSLLVRSLQGLQHQVVGFANNGREAVALARQLQPDLVILDIDMPGMDGVEAARAILSTQDLPIVISTGSVDELTLRRLHHLKIGAYLVKPYSPAQLKAAIYVAASRHRQALEKTNRDVPLT